MAALAAGIMTLPYKISALVQRLGDAVEAHQLLVRQPAHCTVLIALRLNWPEALNEAELSQPDTPLEQEDITARFQTYWSLFREQQQLQCSSDELAARLNLPAPAGQRWLILVTFRCNPGAELYTVCLADRLARVNFPPHTPGKRIIRSPSQTVEAIEALSEEAAVAELDSLQLDRLLGPKRDLWRSTATPTPEWLMLRLARRLVPGAQRLVYRRPAFV
jgi:hypothetical protein